MGCSGCSSASGGCSSNGGCSRGSCNRMDVYDWLADIPFADDISSCKVVEVSFNHGSRKDFFKNTLSQHFSKGELVSVEGVNGFDVGSVNLSGELVRLQMKKYKVDENNPEMKKILRKANENDIARMKESKAKEKGALIRSRAIARQLNLEMKISEVEIQADGKKATFFYIADGRVDFRELIKLYASEFRVKVEMRQIGARQEAAKIGGIGSSGRELCSSTWLSDFKSVNTSVARYQNLSINQTKLSGQCGRLKCCLNFELDTYLDALQHFPTDADTLEVAKGRAVLVKKDIFKNLMWYTLPDSNKQYPLTIESVKKIKAQNREGIRPEELETTEVSSRKPREVEPEYADLVGQISLKSLERTTRRRKDKERSKQQAQSGGNKPNQIAKPERDQKNQQRAASQKSHPNNKHGNRYQQNKQGNSNKHNSGSKPGDTKKS